jgi:hypothetical protein
MNFSPNTQDASEYDISDEELSALALAADLTTPLSKDATAWRGEAAGAGGLPAWYMPRPTARAANGVTKVMILTVVLGFVIINAFGLCVTSGFISIP